MRNLLALPLVLWSLASPAETLDFRAAMRALEQRNTEVQAQNARVKLSEAERSAQAANFLPNLSAQATDRQVETPEFVQSQQGLLLGRLNLFRSGADLAAWRASRAGVEREKSRARATVLASEQNNVKLLIQFIQAHQLQRVAETLVKLNEEIATTETTRFNRGLVPLQEAQKAQIESSNSLARFQDAQGRLAAARASLSAQLGHADVALDWPWKSFLLLDRAQEWVKRDLDLKATPEWIAAEEEIESQKQLSRAKFRDFLPALDWTVGYGYQDYLNSHKMGWDTTLVLTIPLLDFKKQAAYRVQAQQEALAKIDQERVKRELLGRWQETREKLFLALKSANEREASKTMAQSLYQDNQRRLRAGRSNLNDLVVDQNRLADAEILSINGWAEAHVLYAELCHSLGLRVNFESFGCQAMEVPR